MSAASTKRTWSEVYFTENDLAKLTPEQVTYFNNLPKDVIVYLIASKLGNVTDIANYCRTTAALHRKCRKFRIFKLIFLAKYHADEYEAFLARHADEGMINDEWILRAYELARFMEENQKNLARAGLELFDEKNRDNLFLHLSPLSPVNIYGLHFMPDLPTGSMHEIRVALQTHPIRFLLQAKNFRIIVRGLNYYDIEIFRQVAFSNWESCLYALFQIGYHIRNVYKDIADWSFRNLDRVPSLECQVCGSPARYYEDAPKKRLFCGKACQQIIWSV